MAMPASVQGAMFDVVTQFMNSNMTPKAAAEKMAAAAKSK
jgi:glucose/mannose transport system substrate-binding protein